MATRKASGLQVEHAKRARAALHRSENVLKPTPHGQYSMTCGRVLTGVTYAAEAVAFARDLPTTSGIRKAAARQLESATAKLESTCGCASFDGLRGPLRKRRSKKK